MEETSDEAERFAFGENWRRFLPLVDERLAGPKLREEEEG